MINITITGLYAGLLALLFIGLSINIIRLRFQLKVGIGDGGQPKLAKAIRVHGNFSEYIPLVLLLLGCYEINGGGDLWLHILGATIFIGRILHAVGLTKTEGVSLQRQAGMISLFLVIIILAIENIRLFLFN